MICIECLAGECYLCLGGCSCTHSPVESQSETPSPDDERGSTGGRKARRNKSDNALKDAQSTGRKRAAKLYPFLNNDGDNWNDGEERAPCEWRKLANCGGGTKPIIGCLNGTQHARHHGPDKSVVNNEQGNVHRICHGCHNRWHAANNKDYDWNDTTVNSHSPRPMRDEEIIEAMVNETRKYKVIRD